jgi:hypothetical protein
LHPDDFATTYRPQADTVSSATRIDATVLLAQWGVETGWGQFINNQNNLGNIRCFDGWPCAAGFSQFRTLGDFCTAAIETWENGFYTAVLSAVGPNAQILAIGQSAWDAGHYDNGGGPGSSLAEAYALIEGDNLTPEQGDDIIVDAWRNYKFYDGAGNPPVTDVLSDGSLVSAHLDPNMPTVSKIMAAIQEVKDSVGVARVDLVTFIIPMLTQLETDVKNISITSTGTLDLTAVTASLDALKKHLGVGTP